MERTVPLKSAVTQQEREALWESLSDLFIDNEIAWRWIARDCAGYEPSLIRAILFEEVAPVCGPNLCTPIPPVWSGFNRESLIAAIKEHLAKKDAPLWSRALFRFSILFWRWRFASLWKDLAWRLELLNKAATPEEAQAILDGPEFDPE